MKDPLRYWRTGAVAVVVAALGQASAAARAADERQLVRRQSPYNVADTVLRIEGSARQHGLAVFACIEQQARVVAGGRGDDTSLVIVLESSQGGTPVLMGATPTQMELPLSVTVRRTGDGRAEVLIGAADDWDAMPNALASDLATLSAVVGDALQA